MFSIKETMRKLCLSAKFSHLWHDTPLAAYDLGLVVYKKRNIPIQDIVIKRKDLLTFAKDIMNGELDFFLLCGSSKTASSATSSFVKLFQISNTSVYQTSLEKSCLFQKLWLESSVSLANIPFL